MLKEYFSKNSIITSDDHVDVYVDGKNISMMSMDMISKPKYLYANVYINNFSNFVYMCNTLRKSKKEINIILNGVKINDEKDPKKIVSGLKLLPDNIKISYKKLIDNKVEDKEYQTLNPWLTNLSKDDFEMVVGKFNSAEQEYVKKQDQAIKHVYTVLKNMHNTKDVSFDDLTNHEKIDLVFDYLNTHVKITNDQYDPLEVAINKKGDLKSIKELFIVLTNNRRMKLKTGYINDNLIHGFHYYDFSSFRGKQNKKIL